MARYKKAIIIGAGPAGAACAATLRQNGFPEVEIIERHAALRDKPCAGGLSPRAITTLREIDIRWPDDGTSCLVAGARVIGPDGRVMLVKMTHECRTVPRLAFDTRVLDRAQELGAQVTMDLAVDRLLEADGTIVGVGAAGVEKEADVVVVATGARGKLCWDPRPREKLDAVITRFEGVEHDPALSILHFHESTLPNYAWLFPEPGGVVNVGLCRAPRKGRPPLLEALDLVMNECFPELAAGRQIDRPRGHPIVYSSRARHLVRPGAVRVGEAGWLTDPFTGEGIWHALRSGIDAGQAIAEGDLAAYEKKARRVFSPVLGFGHAVFRLGQTSWFWRTVRLSPWKPAAWLFAKTMN